MTSYEKDQIVCEVQRIRVSSVFLKVKMISKYFALVAEQFRVVLVVPATIQALLIP